MTSFQLPGETRKWPIDRRTDTGPFDIIGDVHGCFDELVALFDRLGYEIDPFEPKGEALIGAAHPGKRRAIFVGDFTDRGPQNLNVLRLVMGMCIAGTALAVIGNHDDKLRRWIEGRNVQIAHGLERTIKEFGPVSAKFRKNLFLFIDRLPSHLWLDGGNLVVAHAGLPAEMHGEDSKGARAFAMYGDTTGERDNIGFPVRRDWGRRYSGEATVVYGHTPMREPEWINRTICIDQGCAFGGRLTALRWPEKELVQVRAAQQYWTPKKPLGLRADEPA
ncbi:MAG: metallophosphoesterase [Hyphomicrobiaceae bacterium]